MIRIKPGKMFFKSTKVLLAVDKATRKVLSKFGSFVRTTAKQSIKKPPKKAKIKVSRPGNPPFSQTGMLKKFIFFGYDHNKKSVVIGPTSIHGGTAPELLEYGGKTIRAYGKRREKIKKTITIKARPYMGPAYDENEPKLAAMWRDSVK